MPKPAPRDPEEEEHRVAGRGPERQRPARRDPEGQQILESLSRSLRRYREGNPKSVPS